MWLKEKCWQLRWPRQRIKVTKRATNKSNTSDQAVWPLKTATNDNWCDQRKLLTSEVTQAKKSLWPREPSIKVILVTKQWTQLLMTIDVTQRKLLTTEVTQAKESMWRREPSTKATPVTKQWTQLLMTIDVTERKMLTIEVTQAKNQGDQESHQQK